MVETVRFGISLDEMLLNRIDTLIKEKGYGNLSEAIRDHIRNALVEEGWAKEKLEAVGTVSLVYDHHTSDLSDKFIQYQHSHHRKIISAPHVHLDEHFCLEAADIKGKAKKNRKLPEGLVNTKGVKHGKLMNTTGKGLS